MRTARLNTPTPTVAVDAGGRLYVLDPFRVLTGVATENRPPFTPTRLATIDGDTLATDDLRGRVVLVNFWASWCGPCRVELPALVGLAESISDPDFAFVTMNEDVEVAAARRFVAEVGLAYPVALGKGRLRRRYHYVGLPFTLLLDREGHIVYRWTGFAGDGQVEAIRALIHAELGRDTAAAEPR
jgi:thiol-disulfide isomerase/thioredoxin